jgi:hypothetical protein
MDYLKLNAPFWKSEQRPQQASWVDTLHRDDDAIARWNALVMPEREESCGMPQSSCAA